VKARAFIKTNTFISEDVAAHGRNCLDIKVSDVRLWIGHVRNKLIVLTSTRI